VRESRKGFEQRWIDEQLDLLLLAQKLKDETWVEEIKDTISNFKENSELHWIRSEQKYLSEELYANFEILGAMNEKVKQNTFHMNPEYRSKYETLMKRNHEIKRELIELEIKKREHHEHFPPVIIIGSIEDLL